jgi:hypothetical protein
LTRPDISPRTEENVKVNDPRLSASRRIVSKLHTPVAPRLRFAMKDLPALALLARVYGTHECHFQNIDEVSSEGASLKQQPYMAISGPANRGRRSIT